MTIHPAAARPPARSCGAPSSWALLPRDRWRPTRSSAATAGGATPGFREHRAPARRGLRAPGERAAPGGRLVPVGAVPQRAPVGHRPRGLQPRRHGLGVPARTTTPARAPTAGARTGSRASPTWSSGSASGSRSGTGATRSSRSGSSASPATEGNHGEDAKEYWWYLDAMPSHAVEPLALPLPAGGVPLRGPRRGERRAGQARPRVRAARHGRLRRRPLLDRRGRLREGRPRRPADGRARHQRRPGADRLHVLPTAWYRNTWAWEVDAARPELRGRRRPRHDRAPVPRRARADRRRAVRTGSRPRCCSATTRRTTARLFGAATSSPLPEGRHQRPRRLAAPSGQPRAARHEGVVLVPGRGRSRRDGRAAAAAAPAAQDGRRRGRTSTRSPPRRRKEADEFYAELTPAAASADEANVMRQAFAGMLWSKQFYALRRRALARRRSRPSPARRPRASGAQRELAATSTRSTSCRCPTSGSTRGSPRGTSPSTAWRSRTSTRRSPSTSSRCCAASGSSTPTGRSPPTSGPSTT